ncbi:hypothetical protein [Lutispora thermophila]|uniref:Uncharacterized protein n=1 Tax=Lutispora thermophila DSM 19022 TaxID=1122184 RepID=A0A1M6BA19_9FIRM|nr:hypothetical protein [Lutispora thermophila]SHI45536.1 hypothetical protein SAMN02745176_00351 [Lutispora thermophila DSM 19022]
MFRGINRLVILIFVLSAIYPAGVFANSAEPPGFTIIVSNPPADLSLYILFPDEQGVAPILLSKEGKGWEAYYRFYYHMNPTRSKNLEKAVLKVQSDEKSFQCPLPTTTFKMYNNLLTLDLEQESLKIGQSPLRVPLLVSMRVVFTLIIEGLIFILFGYRKKDSWITFFIINLITQGGLNVLLTGPDLANYWVIAFIFSEIIVIVTEAIAFASLVKEFKKRKAVLYAILANIASLIAGGLLISYLPV